MEALVVAKQLTAFLITQTHLTLSFNGWSSKGHDELYTASVTTPARRSFLFDCLVLTGLPTTGDALFGHLSMVHRLFYNAYPITNIVFL